MLHIHEISIYRDYWRGSTFNQHLLHGSPQNQTVFRGFESTKQLPSLISPTGYLEDVSVPVVMAFTDLQQCWCS